MVLKNITLLGLFLFAGSCNNKGKSSTEVNPDTIVNKTAAITITDSLPSGCYAQIIKRDTSLLQLENKDNIVNGSLSYNIYEKDRNDGTLQADIDKNIVSGWYIFKSEGIVSVRQVSWKINGDELWPAIGEVVQKNDTAMFAQPDKLRYDSLRPFKKVPCVI
jgi:hypothetical protein